MAVCQAIAHLLSSVVKGGRTQKITILLCAAPDLAATFDSVGRPIVKSFGRSDGGFARFFVSRWPCIVKKLGPERERCDQRRGKHSPNFAQLPLCKITFHLQAVMQIDMKI
jgi:hypothetical protein